MTCGIGAPQWHQSRWQIEHVPGTTPQGWHWIR